MSRKNVRTWKRAISAAAVESHDGPLKLARDCALALLARSISFGHGRIAVLRLVTAVRSGAEISPQAWDYCRKASLASQDVSLSALFAAALDEHRMTTAAQAKAQEKVR